MKNALRGMCAVVVACGVGVESGERFEAHKNEVREIFKQTQVRVSCVTPGAAAAQELQLGRRPVSGLRPGLVCVCV